MRGMTRFLFSFDGRISRSRFWLGFVLPSWLGAMLVALLMPAKSIGAYLLLCLWPFLAVSAKRGHDRGRSAWALLLLVVPIVGPWWWLIDLGILPGMPGPNRFGADYRPDSPANRVVDRFSAAIIGPLVAVGFFLITLPLWLFGFIFADAPGLAESLEAGFKQEIVILLVLAALTSGLGFLVAGRRARSWGGDARP